MIDSEFIDSWKNGTVFEKQLELNLIQLNGNYPEHWYTFLHLVKIANPVSILDIGCGAGVFYKLLHNTYPTIEYTGVDYSEEAITLAKDFWKYDNFFVKDLWELDKDYIKNYDLLLLGAILDILPDGDAGLDHILSLKPRQLLLSRIEFTSQESHNYTYLAYNTITTYKFLHNFESFHKIREKYNYNFTLQNNSILLRDRDVYKQ